MTNYPTSLDNGTSLPYPSATDDTNSPSLSSGQDNQNDALIAVETKLGTGSSTPSGTYALVSTGTGTSAWSLATPASTIVGISDTQTLTNKTIDAANNTITNLSGSDLTNNTITATQIANATITGTQLASDLSLSGTLTTGGFIIGNLPVWQYLGSAQITSSISTTSSTFVAATGLSVSVTIPSNATALRVTFKAITQNSASGNICVIGIDVGGTIIDQMYMNEPGNSYNLNSTFMTIQKSPTAGSTTVSIQFCSGAGSTAYIEAGSAGSTAPTSGPAIILVEVC